MNLKLQSVSLVNEIRKNIRSTGNIWGHTTEYVYNFTVPLWRYQLNFEQRRKGSFMGRFGGGWQFKFGIQAGAWDSWIFNYGIGMMRFGKKR